MNRKQFVTETIPSVVSKSITYLDNEQSRNIFLLLFIFYFLFFIFYFIFYFLFFIFFYYLFFFFFIFIFFIFFLKILALSTEGLFRISGSKDQIDQLTVDFDNGKDVNFDSVESPHVVAGLLKHYFREMSEPLLTFPLFREFLKCQAKGKKKIKN